MRWGALYRQCDLNLVMPAHQFSIWFNRNKGIRVSACYRWTLPFERTRLLSASQNAGFSLKWDNPPFQCPRILIMAVRLSHGNCIEIISQSLLNAVAQIRRILYADHLLRVLALGSTRFTLLVNPICLQARVQPM